jgi:hypothetical protein
MQPGMRLLVLLLGVALVLPARAEVDARLTAGKLAVLEFRNKLVDRDRQEVDATYFADVVRSAALRTLPSLSVITRENLVVLLAATGRKLEECEGECEVDTGRRIGADLVVSGDLLKIGTSYKLNLRLHETRGGQLLSGAVASGKSVDELDERTQAAVGELFAPLAAAGKAGKQGQASQSQPPPAQPPASAPVQPTEAPPPSVPTQKPVGTIAVERPQTRTPVLRKVGWALLAVGVAGTGAFLYGLQAGSSATSDIRNGNVSSGADFFSRESDGKRANTIATIGAIAGAAGLIGGAALILLHPTETTTIAIAPQHDGVTLAGRF